MTTTCENDIYHIDGPPINAFAIAEYPDGSGNRVEIVYRVIRFSGDSMEEIQSAWMKIFNIMQAELKELNSSQVNNRFAREIIWWRRRPEFCAGLDEGKCRCYARFATTPPLPDTFWEKYGVPEYEKTPTAKELIDG